MKNVVGRKGLGAVVVLIVLSFYVIGETGSSQKTVNAVEYGDGWTRTCDGARCSLVLGSQNILTPEGFRPMAEVVTFKEQGEYWNLSWNGKSVLLSVLVNASGRMDSVEGVKAVNPSLSFNKYVLVKGFKHGVNITNIPTSIKNSLNQVCFNITQLGGLSGGDMQRITMQHCDRSSCVSYPGLLLPDGLVYDPWAGEGLIVEEPSKGLFCWKNLSGKTDILIDPTIKLTGNSSWVDTFLDSGSGHTTTNYNAQNLYIENHPDNKERTIIGIPIPNFNGTVLSANLTLVYGGNFNQNANISRNATVHQLLKSFNESSATWNKNDSSHSWTTAGGDYNSTVIDSFSPNASTGANNTMQLYGSGAYLNKNATILPNTKLYLLIKYADEANYTDDAYIAFGDSESANPPVLDIDYINGTTTSTTTTTTSTTTTTIPCQIGSACSSCPDWVTINSSQGNVTLRDDNADGKYDMVCCSDTVSNYTIY